MYRMCNPPDEGSQSLKYHVVSDLTSAETFQAFYL